MNSILCIGSCCNPQKNGFSGQAVMFDGVVTHLRQQGTKVEVVNIANTMFSNGVFFRSLEYLAILLVVFYKLLCIRIDLCYITTSQSKKGFFRDKAMITMCKWFRVPVIIHQYGANYHQLLDSLGGTGMQLLKNMLGYVSTIIVEGDYMKEQFSFLPDYKEKVKAIPNGLPIEGKHAQIAKSYDGKQPFIMFYLSNLIWSKGYFDVLQAVDILVNEEGLDVKCVFAGQFWSSVDDERPGISNWEDFDRFVKEHSLTDRVEYHKGLYGEKKDTYFYNANVFLLPTYYLNEGQPVSIIEAMAYGCVPLVTEYRHIPMMVNEANGCFVAPKDPKDIASKIKCLMTHPAIYEEKSRKSIEDYQRKFKFDIYAGKVTECMNAVIS